MHQAALIGEYVKDSSDYGWLQPQQGLSFTHFQKINFCLSM